MSVGDDMEDREIELNRAIEILTEKYNQAWNRSVDFKIGWALYETWREFAYENRKIVPKEDN